MKTLLFLGVAALMIIALSLGNKKESRMSEINKMAGSPLHAKENVLSFPVEAVKMKVPEISELEETYEGLTIEELTKESQELENLLGQSGLIEQANSQKLSVTDQKRLLHYMRAKAVVSMKLFELQSEADI